MKKILLALVTLGAASLLTAGDKAACSSDQSCCCCAGKDGQCADKADAKTAPAEATNETTKTAKK
jgi:hypothetical protein